MARERCKNVYKKIGKHKYTYLYYNVVHYFASTYGFDFNVTYY